MLRMGKDAPSEGRSPNETGLIVLVIVAVCLAGVSLFWEPLLVGGRTLLERGRQTLGLGPSPAVIVGITPGQDQHFVWHDAVYADGHMRRTRFERSETISAGLSAKRKIVTDFDAQGRIVQEQDGTQDGRNLNVYRFVYRSPARDASVSERHDVYVFYDGSADTADQYLDSDEPRLIKGRSAIAGTYSTTLAEFLAVPDRPVVTEPRIAAAPPSREALVGASVGIKDPRPDAPQR